VYFKDVVNPNSSEIEVLLLYSLFYSPDKEAYIGFIPNDQAAFLDQFQKFIIQQKSKQVQVKVNKVIILQFYPQNCLFIDYLAATWSRTSRSKSKYSQTRWAKLNGNSLC
jgi:mediator of RNA polymerase II transcription subunit 25